MSAFSRYIGIDYSGAETPEASLKGEWQREPFGTYRPLSVRYLIVGGYAVSFHAQPRRRETRSSPPRCHRRWGAAIDEYGLIERYLSTDAGPLTSPGGLRDADFPEEGP
jgi:hypothetical protein